MRFSSSRISTEAREEKVIKNQEDISTVTKKIVQNRPFTNKFVSVPQGGGKYIPKQPSARGKNEATKWQSVI